MTRKLLWMFLIITTILMLFFSCTENSVDVPLDSTKAITAFNFEDPPLPEIITGSNISVAVNYQIDPTSLIASFSTTGVSVIVGTTEQISGTTSNDFTDPVVYTVVAEDGSMWDYIVTVNNLARVETTTISGNLTFSVDIAGISAKGGGDVLEEGSSTVIERGLCWNTTGFPVITDSHAADGVGIGEFVDVSMTGLVENTVYYVRAYATNRGGTVYGISRSFNSGYAFGTDFVGGYVFYNNGANGGYVSAKVDQSENQVWIEGGSTQTTLNGNTNAELGTGLANSNAIISQADHTGSAAQICLDYDDGTYSDWFLPSMAGVMAMRKNLRWNGFGDFTTDDYYWSSSEGRPEDGGDSTAYCIYFDGDWINICTKSDSLRVRAIREF